MRAADYVFDYLQQFGINHVFMLAGGGIMHLVDALGRSNIDYVCCHHEQSAAIAAQAYGMYNDSLGVCLVTTGPGGTNALTGTGAAFMDSTPVLFISGQVKRSDFASLRGVRQFGAQENDIVSMAKPVTKYAVTVMDPNNIRYELEKCVYEATHGRKGPVWLDIPLDIQATDINPENLRAFIPGTATAINNAAWGADETLKLLKNSKRPLILAGHGLNSSEAKQELHKFVEITGIPVVSTWRALDFMGSDEDLFFGSPGLQAPRYSNLILQHCDFLLVLGSRLDNMITAFSEERFAKMANVAVVDIDEKEINKLKIPRLTRITSDVKSFIEQLFSKASQTILPNYSHWIEKCSRIKKRFPLLEEPQTVNDGVDLYRVTNAVSKLASVDDTIVVSSTSRCNTAGHIAFQRKRGQKSISSMGFGSMGFALPSVVGAYYASGKKRIVMFEGDGSLQLNLQELETIVSNGINARMFIFNNTGYAAITTMQDRNFDGFYVGSNEKSGLFLPNMEKIANAYDIPYRCIKSNDEIEEAVNWAMVENTGTCIVDIMGSLTFDEIPKCISRIDETTGQRVSAFLENPFPFLSEKEMNEIERFMLTD